MKYTEKPDTPEEVLLAHYGTKGMRWGVRKQQQLAKATRIAEGTANRRQKVGYALTTPVARLVAGGGNLKKIAKREQNKLEEQKRRIDLGKSTVADKLDIIGQTTIIDVVRAARKK